MELGLLEEDFRSWRRNHLNMNAIDRKGRINTILATHDIIRALEKEHQKTTPKLEERKLRDRRDAIRLSKLYGRGLKSIKSIKRSRKKKPDPQEIRDKEFVFSEKDLESCHHKLLSCHNIYEIGIAPLECEGESKYMTVIDIRLLLEFHFNLKLSNGELASMLQHMNVTKGSGEKMKILMRPFLTSLKRLVDNNRNSIRTTRRKDQESIEAMKAKRASYRLRTYDNQMLFDGDLDHESLLGAIEKISSAATKTRERNPKFFSSLCQTFQREPIVTNSVIVGGTLDVGGLRDFCKYNLDIQLSLSEAKSVILFYDSIGTCTMPLTFLTSQMKLLSLKRPCEMSLSHVQAIVEPKGVDNDELDVLDGEQERKCDEEPSPSKLDLARVITINFIFQTISSGQETLSYSDFQNFSMEIGSCLSDDEVYTVFHTMDEDRDGKIDLEEFGEVCDKVFKQLALLSWQERNLQREINDYVPVVAENHHLDKTKKTSPEASRNKTKASDGDNTSINNDEAKSLLGKPTVSSINQSVLSDTCEYMYIPKYFCENCKRNDHSIQFCDRLCTICVPFCGRRPLKCTKFLEFLRENSKSTKKKLAPLSKDVSVHVRQPHILPLPTSLSQKYVVPKSGGASTLMRAKTPLLAHRAATNLDNINTTKSVSTQDTVSSVFQGDLTRYLQVGLTHLPLDTKAAYLRYNLRWKLMVELVKDLRARKVKIPEFMRRLRVNTLGLGRGRALKVSDKNTPCRPVLEIKDPLGNFGLWVSRQNLLETFTDLNVGGTRTNKHQICSCLDTRRRGGVPCHELVALLTCIDTIIFGKLKVDITKEICQDTQDLGNQEITAIIAIFEMVFASITDDLNAYHDLVSIVGKDDINGSIETLKHRKELLDIAGVDSSFIDSVLKQKELELKGRRFYDYLPEGLIESVFCIFTTSHDAELDICVKVEGMLSQRAKLAALEKLSFTVARPEKTNFQEIPKSYVLEYLGSEKGEAFVDLLHVEIRNLLKKGAPFSTDTSRDN